MDRKKVVILGGYGTFGSLVAQELISTNTHIVVAGRSPEKGLRFAKSIGVDYIYCDSTNHSSLENVLSGSFLVINASGPFQATDYSIPHTCLRLGCHYIDLGDGRDYVTGITQLHQQAQQQHLFLCVGASTSPAVTSAAIMDLKPHFEQIDSIEIALNAGNKNQAGASTIASILSYVGVPIKVWIDQHWQVKCGWSLGQFVQFPSPVGRRRVQLCNVPDLALFPSLFKANEVIFRAGVELTLFNYAIAVLGQLKKLWPALNLPRIADLLVLLSEFFKPFGTLHGSCAVWVTGKQEQRSMAFVAPTNGPRIPTAPAILLSRKLLTGQLVQAGAFPCLGFIGLDEYLQYLEPFGITVVYGENGSWISDPV